MEDGIGKICPHDRVDSYEEGIEEGLEKGLEKGREEGREEGIKNIIRMMLSNGVTKETILKQTGLSNEEYERLIN